MGGQSSQTQTQQSQTAPWQAAQPMLQGILSQLGGDLNNTGLTSAESSALDTLRNNAMQGNPYAGQIGLCSVVAHRRRRNCAVTKCAKQSLVLPKSPGALCQRQHGRQQSRAGRAARANPD